MALTRVNYSVTYSKGLKIVSRVVHCPEHKLYNFIARRRYTGRLRIIIIMLESQARDSVPADAFQPT